MFTGYYISITLIRFIRQLIIIEILFSACVMFYLSYVGWIFYIAFAGGFWVYPILQHLGTGQRAGFIAVCAVFAIFLYLIGETCHKMVWGKEYKINCNVKGECVNSLNLDTSEINRKHKKKRKYT